jgi:hypothetical protein
MPKGNYVRGSDRRHNYKHGGCRDAEYNSWAMMWQRCSNPLAPSYKYHGGRGIRVCKRWDSYPAFLFDMGRRPTPAHSLERVNNERGYSKQNCIWATPAQQARNRRCVKLTLDKAREIRSLYAAGGRRQIDLAEQFGVSQRNISSIVCGRKWQEQ